MGEEEREGVGKREEEEEEVTLPVQLGTPQIFNRHPLLSPPPVLIPQLTTSHHHIHTVRQPPTLPLFVFAASTARSMGLLTRVGICVRPPPPLVRPVHLHPSPPLPPPHSPADPLPQTVHQPSRHQLPSPQCLSATLYRVIIKFPRTDTKRIARPVLAPLSREPRRRVASFLPLHFRRKDGEEGSLQEDSTAFISRRDIPSSIPLIPSYPHLERVKRNCYSNPIFFSLFFLMYRRLKIERRSNVEEEHLGDDT